MSGLVTLRSVLRSLGRSPGYAFASVSLLAIGIAAATIAFSLADALLLKPLSAKTPEQLVRIVSIRPRIGPRSYFPPTYVDLLRSDSKSFINVCGSYDFNSGFEDFKGMERTLMTAVDSSYFETFGINAPANFSDNSILLSHRFWRSRYGESKDVIGKTVSIRGISFVISGVLPRGFHGSSLEAGSSVFIPMNALGSLFSPRTQFLNNLQLEVVARLAPGVNIESAKQDAYRLHIHSAGTTPISDREFDLEALTHGSSRLRTQAGSAAQFALWASLILVVLVCANVSGLVLARLMSRGPELALRRALGASMLELAGIATWECAILTTSAALLATLLSVAGIDWLSNHLPPVRLFDNTATPMTLSLAPGWRIWLFTLITTFAVMLCSALVPAIRAAGSNANAVLRASTSSSGMRGWRGLITVQVALCTALLLGSTALTATLANLFNESTGFDQSHLVSFSVDRDLSAANNPQRFIADTQQWLQRVKQLPNVSNAALAEIRMFRGSGRKTTIAQAGAMVPMSDFMNTSTQSISPGYFDTVGQRLIEGRRLQDSDSNPLSNGLRPVVVNQAFVARFGQGKSVVGKSFGFGAGKAVSAEVQVIGVVSDAKYRSVREPIQPTMYGLLGNEYSRITLLVNTSSQSASLIASVRDQLRAISTHLYAEDIATMQQDIENSLWNERALAFLANTLAVFSALVAMAGISALASYLATMRTREIGIRCALGASTSNILKWFLNQIWLPLLGGLMGGILLSETIEQTVQSLLYGVSLRDSGLTLISAGGVFCAGLLAVLLPAFRAARIEPWKALRNG